MGLGEGDHRGDRLPTLVFLGFPGGSEGKESACSAGDLGSIPGLGRSPGVGHGNSLQYSGLGNVIAGRNNNNLRYSKDITFMAESKEELKSLLMKMRDESEKLA